MSKIWTSLASILLTAVTTFATTFSFTNQWPGGGQGLFRITNDTAQNIQGWTLEFDWNAEITSAWNGTIQSHVGNHYIIINAPYNATIAPGAYVEVGCAANFAVAGVLPTAITVNGISGGGTGGGGTTIVPSIVIDDASITLAAVSSGSGAAAGYFSTSGNQIIDANGNPVRITGVNWFGFETSNKVFHGLWTRGYKSMLDQVKSLGFNTLRIPYCNEMLAAGATTNSINFAQNPDLQGLTPLQCMDKVVDYCGQIGLRVFLDRHSAKADNFIGEDVWYIPGDAYYTESRWISDWVMLAQHYAGNSTVIGADLFNEPKKSATWGNSAPATDWNKAAERCGNAVLAANPNWLIIVEGVEKYNNQTTWWGGNLTGAAAFPVVLSVNNKLVYSPHDYPSSVFEQTWFSDATYPNNMDDVWNSHWGYIYKNNIAPILIGEFGSRLATTSDQLWLDKLTDYMNGDLDLNGSNDLAAGKLGMSWTYWCMNPNSGDTGGILNDDWTTVSTARMAYLQASLAPSLGAGSAGPAPQYMNFPVTLSAAASGAVTVAYTTVNGTAIAGTNYTTASGTLSFAAGETTKNITVAIPNQAATTGKQFTVQLSSVVGATLADAAATGTLLSTTLPSAPVITSASTASGSVGVAFEYQITASGSATSYSAIGLPSGLSLNTTTGLISGSPTTVAASTITIRATNAGGTGSASLALTVTQVAQCSGDVNMDSTVDAADVGAMLGNWGSASSLYDLNSDGVTDSADLAVVLGAWGPCLSSETSSPTDGFTEVPFTYYIQSPYDLDLRDRYSLVNDTHDFKVLSTDQPFQVGNTTKPRTEMRIYNNYTSEVWQFEGDLFVPAGTTGAAVMQVFGGSTSSTSCQLRVYNGSLCYYTTPIMNNIHDTWIHVNVIHDANAHTISIYLNGTFIRSQADRGPSTYYFKCGVYQQDNSSSLMQSKWANIKVWRG